MKYSDEAVITLSGGEKEIEFIHSHNFYHIQNLGTADIKISAAPKINGRDDGVIEIPAGGSATISSGKEDKIYIYGSGKINIAASDSGINPFRNPSKGGDSGGGGTGGVSTYAELPDKPGINGFIIPPGDETTFEQLGWHKLTTDNAISIVDKAFDKLLPYKILAEYSLTDNFDGYGFDIFEKGTNTDNKFNNGLLLDRYSYFKARLPDVDLSSIKTLKIEFDTMPLEFTNQTMVIFGCRLNNVNGSKRAWYVRYNGSYDVWKFELVRAYNNSSNSKSLTPIPPYNEWTHITLLLDNYQKDCSIQINDGEPVLYTPSFDTIPYNDPYFIIGDDEMTQWAKSTRIKNLLITEIRQEG